MLDLLLIALGLVGLFFGGEWLIRAATRLAAALGVPALMVGLTVVAVGTSMPELVVSVSAALSGTPDLAVGSLVGSNIANIGLILGIAGLITPLTLHILLVRREVPVMIGVTALVMLFMSDGQVSRFEGVVLLLGYVGFVFVLYRFRPNDSTPPALAAEVEALEATTRPRLAPAAALLVAALGLLIAGAQLTVTGATNLALALGIPKVVIGLTLVAVGTSLPEIATSVMASLRGHSDIAAGNAIGSNIANLLIILGMTSAIAPIRVPVSILRFDMWVMLTLAVVVLPLAWDNRLSRWQAALLLAAYASFVLYTFTAPPPV